MSNAIHWSILAALALDTVAYLAVLSHFLTYLRATHTATWANLGRPTMRIGIEAAENPKKVARAGYQLFKFIFGRQYKELGDDHMVRLIWCIRALLALAIPLIVLAIATEANR
jgi:hypothetical protein